MSASPTSAFPTRIGLDEALAIVRAVAEKRRLGSESLALQRAHGRVLARDLQAVGDQPGFDNSAMDGFALRHADLASEGETTLMLLGEQFAGRALDVEVQPGTYAGRFIRPGDMVTAVNGQEVKSVADLKARIPGGINSVSIGRDGMVQTIQFR